MANTRNPSNAKSAPDPNQGHTREWPSTPYSDEARAAAPNPSIAFTIALIGDCTVACDYFPPSNRPENHLSVRMRRAFPTLPPRIVNLARNGETADGFLRPERWDAAFAGVARIDAAFIRYGINDRKRHGVDACVGHLSALCGALQKRYQGSKLFLETGIWVDYPRHYLWDRNAALAPLYQAIVALARTEGHGVVDIFARTKAEICRGNWDLRVRGLPAPEHTIVDDAFDRFFGDDPAFFTNIHPNSRCLGLIAEWEVEALQDCLAARLPGPAPPDA